MSVRAPAIAAMLLAQAYVTHVRDGVVLAEDFSRTCLRTAVVMTGRAVLATNVAWPASRETLAEEKLSVTAAAVENASIVLRNKCTKTRLVAVANADLASSDLQKQKWFATEVAVVPVTSATLAVRAPRELLYGAKASQPDQPRE